MSSMSGTVLIWRKVPYLNLNSFRNPKNVVRKTEKEQFVEFKLKTESTEGKKSDGN